MVAFVPLAPPLARDEQRSRTQHVQGAVMPDHLAYVPLWVVVALMQGEVYHGLRSSAVKCTPTNSKRLYCAMCRRQDQLMNAMLLRRNLCAITDDPRSAKLLREGGRGLTKLKMFGASGTQAWKTRGFQSLFGCAALGVWSPWGGVRNLEASLLVGWDQRREDQVGGAAHRLGREHPTTGREGPCSEPAEPPSGKDNLPIASEAEAWPRTRRERHLHREENTRLGRQKPHSVPMHLRRSDG